MQIAADKILIKYFNMPNYTTGEFLASTKTTITQNTNSQPIKQQGVTTFRSKPVSIHKKKRFNPDSASLDKKCRRKVFLRKKKLTLDYKTLIKEVMSSRSKK